jgi:hypothetical protein
MFAAYLHYNFSMGNNNYIKVNEMAQQKLENSQDILHQEGGNYE